MSHIRTVRGDIPAAGSGTWSSHEHLLCSQRSFFSPTPDRELAEVLVTMDRFKAVAEDPLACADNLELSDIAVAAAELGDFAASGGTTMVDLTTADFGRNPAALRRLSEATGVNIVMGTGRYVEATHPASARRATVEELTEVMGRDIVDGVDGTGVRAGVIGEIGCSGDITAAERDTLAAAAQAQQVTGVPVAVHPPIPTQQAGELVLNLLEKAGADLTRVALCHTDHQASDFIYQKRLLDRGCWLMFDRFGNSWPYRSTEGWGEPEDEARIHAILALADAGFGDRILVGQDVCMKVNLRSAGGKGYGHLLGAVRDAFAARGVADLFSRLVVDNPRNFFAI